MGPRSSRRPVILVAEDNEDLRETIVYLLRLRHFEVIEATNGGEAIDLCRREVPDLLVTDLEMPGIDGISAIKYLRRDERLRGIPVLAMSAYGEWGMSLFVDIETMGDAPIEYLSKPMSLDALEEAIRKLLPAGGER